MTLFSFASQHFLSFVYFHHFDQIRKSQLLIYLSFRYKLSLNSIVLFNKISFNQIWCMLCILQFYVYRTSIYTNCKEDIKQITYQSTDQMYYQKSYLLIRLGEGILVYWSDLIRKNRNFSCTLISCLHSLVNTPDDQHHDLREKEKSH